MISDMIPQGYPLYLRWAERDGGEVVAARAPVIGWIKEPENVHRIGPPRFRPVVLADGGTHILAPGEWEVAP